MKRCTWTVGQGFDKQGKALDQARINSARSQTLDLVTRLYGGATSYKTAGEWMSPGR